MRRPPRARTRGARHAGAGRATAARRFGGATKALSRASPSSPRYRPASSGTSRISAGAARRTSPLIPVALCTTANSTVRAASPNRMRWSRRGMHGRLGAARQDALGIFRSRARGWTNVCCGEKPRSGDAAEPTGAAVDLEPDLAAAVGAVAAPAAGKLREQAEAEAFGPDGLGIEAVALVGDLDAREILRQAGEEDDALVAAQTGVPDGGADDLRGEEGDGGVDVLVQAMAGQRAARQPRRLGARLEGQEHFAALGGDGHGRGLPRPALPHARGARIIGRLTRDVPRRMGPRGAHAGALGGAGPDVHHHSGTPAPRGMNITRCGPFARRSRPPRRRRPRRRPARTRTADGAGRRA